ncbi:DUF2335 domain-containing protein [Snodgrassella gandavensis]|uniref:DUF2335 domain-containing protein n=1 Tax=Snodgrassella gandavensis TaxID=2946698 RepID=UPI001EF65C88|nr:DUF2335 domain-containing protein [Snodgrassella gandavensis]
MSDNQRRDSEETKASCPQSQNTEKEICQLEELDILDKLEENPQLVSKIIARFHSGPLPSPEDLAMYNQLIPNGADRIMQSVEKEQLARIELDRHKTECDINYINKSLQLQQRGQWIAFVAVLLFFILSFLLIWTGSPALGASIMGASLVAIVTIFITGKAIKSESK